MFPEFSIPISVFLGLYAFFILFYVIYSLFNIYHLVRFGVSGPFLFGLLGVYLIGTVVLLAMSGLSLMRFDWSTPFSITTLLQGPEPASLFKL